MEIFKFLIEHLSIPATMIFIFIYGHKQWLKKTYHPQFIRLLYNLQTVVGFLDIICSTDFFINNRQKILDYVKNSIDPVFLPCLDDRFYAKPFGCERIANDMVNDLALLKVDIMYLTKNNRIEFKKALAVCMKDIKKLKSKYAFK